MNQLFNLLVNLLDLTFPHYFSMAKYGSEQRVILNETEMTQRNHVKPSKNRRKKFWFSKSIFPLQFTTRINNKAKTKSWLVWNCLPLIEISLANKISSANNKEISFKEFFIPYLFLISLTSSLKN